MCGITGAVWTDPTLAIGEALLARMTDRLRHRGPDAAGSYISELEVRAPYQNRPGVALGHRRLSVIDLEASRQPLANEDGSIRVVFNGEIYNFQALRSRLQAAGHEFHSTGDTEVLVHLYEDEGADFLRHLNGMFALAIWDERRGELLLARDRLGQKPLYYRREAQRLLFASELKSLLQVPGIAHDIDPGSIDEFLTLQYVPHPNTILRGFHKLPPGHVAIFADDQFEMRSYWQPSFEEKCDLSHDSWCRLVRDTVGHAVRDRLVSDVPLGAFLSGGIDSSIIVALMQRLAQESGTSESIKTFSMGFPHAEYDETSFAEKVAEYLGTDHTSFRIDPKSVEVVSPVIEMMDEPFGDSSIIPTYLLSRLTREHVTVALSGDGGDELFAGYERYQAMRWIDQADHLPRSLVLGLASALRRVVPSGATQKSTRRRVSRFLEVLCLDREHRYAELVGIFNESRRADLYQEDFIESLPASDPVEFLSRQRQRCLTRDPLTQISVTDIFTYLPCDICHKVDQATMAHGLEVRQPLLDHRVVELALSMPAGEKLVGRRGKRILQRAFGHLLPADVFRRRKTGFGAPLDHWFRNEFRDLVNDTLLTREPRIATYIRSEAVERLIAEHMQGLFDHSARIWPLLVLERWLEKVG